MNQMLWMEQFNAPSREGWLEIVILATLIYTLFRFFQGTRGSSILTGLLVLFGALYAITSIINLDVLNWLLSRLTLYFSLALIIIFQPEIRRALARLGRQPWRKNGLATQRNLVGPITQATQTLSEQKIGALIAIEREIGTRAIQDSGTPIHATVTAELITSIFFPRSPLHDGGIIIGGETIRAAGCLFPLSQKEQPQKTLGTRHRAAIGITEETDAVVVVISEETGAISLAYNGKLRRGLSHERFQRILTNLLSRKQTGLTRFREKIDSGEAPPSDAPLEVPTSGGPNA
ncbi:MAG: TIGR00159 family protein [Kiritimatiellaceae bacterium]|mgnify:FL=1|nr:MAG: TIGR00159 family protein [Kiritimatiellaceae bacterium]